MSATDDLIRSTDEKMLIALVMKLTGGWANPAVVRTHIARIKGTPPEAKKPEADLDKLGWGRLDP